MATFELETTTPLMFIMAELQSIDPNTTLQLMGESYGPTLDAPATLPLLETRIRLSITSDVLSEEDIAPYRIQVEQQVRWGRSAVARFRAARAIAKAIPNWATWSQADLLAWYNANISDTQINAVTSLAQAKIILSKQSAAILSIAKLLIAFRDFQWPDLQDR